MNKTIKVVINIVAFVVFLSMIIVGQKHIGIPGLCIMLVGLTGLLTQLFLYNKKNK
jgi:hypothetical protein